MNTFTDSVPVEPRWALVLGVSSGIGAGVTRALARTGRRIVGVHLDLAEREGEVVALQSELRSNGVDVHFFNANAAADGTIAELTRNLPGLTAGRTLNVLVHSLAFGALLPFISNPEIEGGQQVTRRQLEMTLGVMAHSLVYWVQALIATQALADGAKIFALTSAGGQRVAPGYGAVSAAKAALESHVRQLAFELASRGIAVNAVRAGVTDTPSFRKIPGADALAERALTANPFRRLTTPEDIGLAIAGLCSIASPWMTGNVLGVDGAEMHGG